MYLHITIIKGSCGYLLTTTLSRLITFLYMPNNFINNLCIYKPRPLKVVVDTQSPKGDDTFDVNTVPLHTQ